MRHRSGSASDAPADERGRRARSPLQLARSPGQRGRAQPSARQGDSHQMPWTNSRWLRRSPAKESARSSSSPYVSLRAQSTIATRIGVRPRNSSAVAHQSGYQRHPPGDSCRLPWIDVRSGRAWERGALSDRPWDDLRDLLARRPLTSWSVSAFYSAFLVSVGAPSCALTVSPRA